MNRNMVTKGDSYKMNHAPMYLPGTEYVVSYLAARKGAKFDETVFFGLQYLLKEYLTTPVTMADIDRAEPLIKAHMGSFDRAKWEYIVKIHNGKLPVVIEAVPEGSVIPVGDGNVLMQVYNTDPKCFWLTNHLETLLTHVWAPSTIATQSRAVKEYLKTALEKTCDDGANFGGLNFMLHDFGKRGVSSIESGGIGGLGHLVNFSGTDTIIALETAMEYYGATGPVGYSVNATEHSIMTAAGKEGEEEVIQHILDNFPMGILSVVSDSYDYKNCVENLYGKKFKDQILARDGKLVVRPDSGDPTELVPWTLEALGNAFGYTVNRKGYKVLNPKVGLIWGDGIDFEMLQKIVISAYAIGWSTENLVFGMGGGLLQKINRDTQRFAFKSCAQMRNGVWHDVYKEPTDKSKASKRGILDLALTPEGTLVTVRRDNNPYGNSLLQKVYENGELLVDWTFDQVRENVKKEY